MYETGVVQLAMHKAFPPGPQHSLQQKCSWAAPMWTDKGKSRTLPPDRSSEWEPLLPPLCITQERNQGGISWKWYLLPADNMLTHSLLGAENISLFHQVFYLCYILPHLHSSQHSLHTFMHHLVFLDLLKSSSGGQDISHDTGLSFLSNRRLSECWRQFCTAKNWKLKSPSRTGKESCHPHAYIPFRPVTKEWELSFLLSWSLVL